MTFKQKVQNIWDYDKWYILGGIVILICLFLFVKDVFFKEKVDVQVVSVAYGYLSKDQVETTEKVLSEFTEDINGDGKTTVNLLNIEFSPKNASRPQLDREANTQFMAEASMQENCIFIIDKTQFEKIWKEDYSSLTDLSTLADFDENTYFIPISETALSERLPFLDENLLFIVRIPYSQDAMGSYEEALKFARKLLNS